MYSNTLSPVAGDGVNVKHVVENSFDLSSVLSPDPEAGQYRLPYTEAGPGPKTEDGFLSNMSMSMAQLHTLDSVPEILQFSENELSEFNLYFE